MTDAISEEILNSLDSLDARINREIIQILEQHPYTRKQLYEIFEQSGQSKNAMASRLVGLHHNGWISFAFDTFPNEEIAITEYGKNMLVCLKKCQEILLK